MMVDATNGGNMDDLDALKRITAYIRQARADLAEGLAELERLEISRVVPEIPEHVREELESRN